MKRFIGVYNYTVILTFLSLLLAMIGSWRALAGDFISPAVCLALAGLCDAFDGRVARSKKNRTEDEKNYGIQLDSLVDVISFGFFPALVCYCMGMDGIAGMTVLFLYCCCAVIRLAFFNVLETKRQQTETTVMKAYRGLPVTSVAFFMPVVFCLQGFVPGSVYIIALHCIMALTSLLFVLNFSLKKPGLKQILLMSALASVLLAILLVIFLVLR